MTIQQADMTIREQYEAWCKSKGLLPCENRWEGWLAAHEALQAMGEEAAWALVDGADSEWVHQAPTTHPNVRDEWLRGGEKVFPLYRARADVAATIERLKGLVAHLQGRLDNIRTQDNDAASPGELANGIPASLMRLARAGAATKDMAGEKDGRLEQVVREMLDAAPPAPLPKDHVAVRREWLPVMNEIRHRGNADFDPSMADGFEVHLSTEQWGPVLDAELGLNAAPNQSPDQGPTP